MLRALRALRNSGTAIAARNPWLRQQASAAAEAPHPPPGGDQSCGVRALNHVALAVPAGGLAAAAERWRDVLGAQVSAPLPLPEHGVTVCFVSLSNTKLELLEPLGGDKSPLASYLTRNPYGGLHHISLGA